MLTRVTWVRLARGRRGLEALQSVLILGAAFVVVVGVKRVYTEQAAPQAKAGVTEALDTGGAGGSGGKDGTAAKNPGGGTELGSLSEKEESGGRGPGTVSEWKSDPGGTSYGRYQMSKNSGNADAFVKEHFPDDFKGLTAGTDAFTKKWKEVVDRDVEKFKAAEHEYIKKNLYDKAAAAVGKKPLELDAGARSAALRDVLWSAAVQHGNSGAAKVFENAVKPLLKGRTLADVTDREIIEAVYAERGRKNADGKLVWFSKTPADAQPNLSARFEREAKEALRRLAQ